MAHKRHVKKGDRVIVITGSHRGKIGNISHVLVEDNRVVVQGVNVVKRHIRPSADHPEGVIEKELSLHISNVAHVDPTSEKASKMGRKIVDNTKVRFLKSSGKEI